ncbi:MAG: hypothetical protein P1V51_21920 [Deltaproteobacteria bacterium]|nr:hypothetical protein [Deltaproteobacteria bacterium]
MQKTALSLTLALLLSLGGCVALGWKFGPGFPCTGGQLFEAPPVVEHRVDGYYLAWTQGRHPFYFQPSYKVLEGRLVFSVVSTSSSGSLSGRQRELKIEGKANLEALRSGGAFWWSLEPEPEGTFLALELVQVP